MAESVCVCEDTLDMKWSGSSRTSVGSLEFPLPVPSRAASLFIMCNSVLNVMHYCYYYYYYFLLLLKSLFFFYKKKRINVHVIGFVCEMQAERKLF